MSYATQRYSAPSKSLYPLDAPVSISQVWSRNALGAVAACLFAVMFCGCRGPFNPFSSLSGRTSESPNFDRLLELEGSSAAGNGTSGSHTQVGQRRPGGNAAAARHTAAANDPSASVSSNSFAAENPPAATVARRAISDDSEIVVEGMSDDQQELLRQTEVALSRLTDSPRQAEEAKTDEDSSGGTVAIRLSDRETGDATSETGFTGSSSRQAVVASMSESASSSESSVEAATFNRYKDSGHAQSFSDVADVPVSPASAEIKWDEHLRIAMQQLSELSSQQEAGTLSPKQRMHHAVTQRLLALALGDREQMAVPVEGLQPLEQDYIRFQLSAFADAIDPEANPVSSRHWSLVMLNQRKAHDYLTALSNLEINNLSFCTEVESFGVIEKFPKYQFAADQEVLLYCELDNFVSEKTKDGKAYETQLQGSYEIVDSSGVRVADQQLPTDTHVCRNRRRDYFIAYRIYMPQNLSGGKYTLKLTIEDVKGRKFGQADVEFQVQ